MRYLLIQLKMAAVALITCQNSRLQELESGFKRLKEKPRESFNINLVQMRMNAMQQIHNEAREAHFNIISLEHAEVENYVGANTFTRLQNLYEDASDFLMQVLSELEKENDASIRANESTANERNASQLHLLQQNCRASHYRHFRGTTTNGKIFANFTRPLSMMFQTWTIRLNLVT